jgi:uncharacterized membrane protein YfcA
MVIEKALLVFGVALIVDILWVWYIKSVDSDKAWQASTSGTLIYSISAVITIHYVENHWYLIPMILGAFLGTFFAIKIKKKFNEI